MCPYFFENLPAEFQFVFKKWDEERKSYVRPGKDVASTKQDRLSLVLC